MQKRLLVVGSDSVHVHNFIELVKGNFDKVVLLTDIRHRESKIRTIGIDFSLGWSSFENIKKIKDVIKNFQPTTIHMHQANSYSFLTLRASANYKCQKVLTAWGSDILLNPQDSFIMKQIVKYIINRVDAITADSDTVLEATQKLTKKALVLKNINFGIPPINCETFEKEYIIYSNRLHKSLYNIDKIIHAFARLYQTEPYWRLIVAGDGEKTLELKQLVRSLGVEQAVEFVGWVDTAQNNYYYCKSKIYASIPSSDSISLSLVEAICAGCVPFVSDIQANREIITHDLGFIIHDLNQLDFKRYLEIERNRYEYRREEIRDRFSKELNKEKYIALYESYNG
ncbi:MAG: glycosyltransferase family 4 protein [Epsilonproteobacteria bacterium]|nr:glycosyltransferase family 4 protein [Campylobacterota bacterium]MBD3839177.1 glycosyltransferase family 4 protein [Campylobacterota bacterium]